MPNHLPPDDQPPRKVRTSRRFSEELIEDTRVAFQKRTNRKLTAEDARQILENLVGFFTVLHEWDRAQNHKPQQESVEKKGD